MTNPFSLLGINDEVVNAITALGFEKPTPIQEQAIPVLLSGNQDFVGLAQTGTGKTAAFGLPLIEQIDFSNRKPQVLILCPTRELCLQITSDLKNFSKNIRNVGIVAVYGGASIVTQLREIKQGVQIVVATPGRMLDIIGRKAIDFSLVKYVVLDEADEMLNMGFQEDINEILSTTPTEKKTWLFSATMPPEVRRIAKNYMTDPFELTIGTKNTGNVNIEHEYYVVRARDKYACLKRIVDFNPEIFGVVFCKTKMDTQEVAEKLMKDGYNADALHGDLSQQQRDKVMKRFRERNMQLLIATDVAARGIDVNNVTHVVNYSLPDDIESYTHRSGRTARAGKTGTSIAIINSKEIGKVRQIEKIIGKKFNKAEVPTGFDVCEKQLFSLIHKVHEVEVNEKQMEQYIPRIMAEFTDLEKEEIIKRFASLEFNRFLSYYQNAPDLNANVAEDSRDRERLRGRGGKDDFTRLFINLGSVDGLGRGELLGYVCDTARVSGKSIGRIDIKGVFSFFEIEDALVEQLFESFKTAEFEGRSVRIERSGEERSGGSGRSSDGRSRSSSGSYSGGGSDRRRRSDDGGGRSGGGNSGGFRDFSGKRREDRRSSGGSSSGAGRTDRKRRER